MQHNKMNQQLIKPKPEPKLEDYVNLAREHFEVEQRFSTKFGHKNICMILDADDKAEVMFFEWITKTTHDAYLLLSDGTVVSFSSAELKCAHGTQFIQFFEKGMTLDDVKKCF